MVNNMNANSDHTLPRLQERRNEKLNTTGLIRKITFGNIKLNEAKASIKSNEVRLIIEHNKVQASIEPSQARVIYMLSQAQI